MKLKTYIYLIILAILHIGCVNINKNSEIYEDGVSYKLALLRSSFIKNVNYNLSFEIPKEKDSIVNGYLTLNFDINKKKFNKDLPIDFKESIDNIKSLYINGKESEFEYRNEHIIIPLKEINNGENSIQISFIAGEQSLNRNNDYNYTLLVPDRARTLFPCFDQPNLKASYDLSLTIPTEWEGIANSACIDTIYNNEYKTLKFATTEPLSTYLFSFVSGKFNKSVHNKNGREVIIYHRETEQQKTDQLEDIANEVYSSLDWLEDYTAIKYPFSKYDMIILPGFQYGGMEHTGATLYNNRTLFLPSSPTLSQKLSRAQLIAHETAHMWFGDYVTMNWFSGVWIKEVRSEERRGGKEWRL